MEVRRGLERSRILDEFAAITGYHRKHAIRLLSGLGDREKGQSHIVTPGQVGSWRGRYGPEVRDALIQLWECRVAAKPAVAALSPEGSGGHCATADFFPKAGGCKCYCLLLAAARKV